MNPGCLSKGIVGAGDMILYDFREDFDSPD